jgi:hypothetical protein
LAVAAHVASGRSPGGEPVGHSEEKVANLFGLGAVLIEPTAAPKFFGQSLAENQNTAYAELMNIADRHIAVFRSGTTKASNPSGERSIGKSFRAHNARNPLKRPDSDEGIQGNPRKSNKDRKAIQT